METSGIMPNALRCKHGQTLPHSVTLNLGVRVHHLMIRSTALLPMKFALTIPTYARVADLLMFST